jgi:hypothetical protein
MDYQKYHNELFFAVLSFDLSFDDIFFFIFNSDYHQYTPPPPFDVCFDDVFFLDFGF